MRQRSSPWHLLILLLLVAIAAVGGMEYLRRQQVAATNSVSAQVTDAVAKVNSLKQREAALAKSREQRQYIEDHLMKAGDGEYFAQLLRTVVGAARESNVTADIASFANPVEIGEVKTGAVNMDVTGTEAQIREFIRLVEEGQPFGRFTQLAWNGEFSRSFREDANPVKLTARFQLYGP